MPFNPEDIAQWKNDALFQSCSDRFDTRYPTPWLSPPDIRCEIYRFSKDKKVNSQFDLEWIPAAHSDRKLDFFFANLFQIPDTNTKIYEPFHNLAFSSIDTSQMNQANTLRWKGGLEIKSTGNFRTKKIYRKFFLNMR